ncbi:MAG: hypothetical protein IPM57_11910 [Oligoflexia bacterium]|nr:hypothetical protein [Oligoflexia bacterium]
MRASFFLIINAIILCYLVFRIFISANRRSRPKTKSEEFTGGGFKREFFDIFTTAANSRPHEKSLNCHFQFQGKTYDAYQVLGVPAGAPFQECKHAYEELVNEKESTSLAYSKDVINAALNALQRSKS